MQDLQFVAASDLSYKPHVRNEWVVSDGMLTGCECGMRSGNSSSARRTGTPVSGIRVTTGGSELESSARGGPTG